jgi:hypothetical protein
MVPVVGNVQPDWKPQFEMFAIAGRSLADCAPVTLRLGLSRLSVDGRLPVDVSAGHTLDLSAEIRGVFGLDAPNRVTSCRNHRCSFDYAFSPTGNSASLKGTPQPPMPQ